MKKADIANILSQFFIRNQLAHWNTLGIKTADVTWPFIRITNSQNVYWFQIGGKFKLFAEDIRFEVADPHRTQSQFCCLNHHMVGQDRGINVTGLFFIKGTYPRFVVVSTYDNRQRRTIRIC